MQEEVEDLEVKNEEENAENISLSVSAPSKVLRASLNEPAVTLSQRSEGVASMEVRSLRNLPPPPRTHPVESPSEQCFASSDAEFQGTRETSAGRSSLANSSMPSQAMGKSSLASKDLSVLGSDGGLEGVPDAVASTGKQANSSNLDSQAAAVVGEKPESSSLPFIAEKAPKARVNSLAAALYPKTATSFTKSAELSPPTVYTIKRLLEALVVIRSGITKSKLGFSVIGSRNESAFGDSGRGSAGGDWGGRDGDGSLSSVSRLKQDRSSASRLRHDGGADLYSDSYSSRKERYGGFKEPKLGQSSGSGDLSIDMRSMRAPMNSAVSTQRGRYLAPPDQSVFNRSAGDSFSNLGGSSKWGGGQPSSTSSAASVRQVVSSPVIPPGIVQASIPPKSRIALSSKSGEAERNDPLRRSIKSLLNKLTMDNFSVIVEQLAVISENLKTGSDVHALALLVTDKAVTELDYSEMYADMCCILRWRCPGPEESNSFKRHLISRCETNFQDLKTISFEPTSEEVATLSEKDLEVLFHSRKIRVLGVVRFIGHLFLRRNIPDSILNEVFNHMLNLNNDVYPDERMVEFAVELFTTIGYTLQEKDVVYTQFLLDRLITLQSEANYSIRIYYKIQSLLDLEKCEWNQKIFHDKAKTVAQVKQDFEEENLVGGAILVAQMGKYAIAGTVHEMPYIDYFRAQRYHFKLVNRKISAKDTGSSQNEPRKDAESPAASVSQSLHMQANESTSISPTKEASRLQLGGSPKNASTAASSTQNASRKMPEASSGDSESVSSTLSFRVSSDAHGITKPTSKHSSLASSSDTSKLSARLAKITEFYGITDCDITKLSSRPASSTSEGDCQMDILLNFCYDVLTSSLISPVKKPEIIACITSLTIELNLDSESFIWSLTERILGAASAETQEMKAKFAEVLSKLLVENSWIYTRTSIKLCLPVDTQAKLEFCMKILRNAKTLCEASSVKFDDLMEFVMKQLPQGMRETLAARMAGS